MMIRKMTIMMIRIMIIMMIRIMMIMMIRIMIIMMIRIMILMMIIRMITTTIMIISISSKKKQESKILDQFDTQGNAPLLRQEMRMRST